MIAEVVIRRSLLSSVLIYYHDIKRFYNSLTFGIFRLNRVQTEISIDVLNTNSHALHVRSNRALVVHLVQ